MEAKFTGDHRVVLLFGPVDEGYVFTYSLVSRLLSVPVRDLVAQRGPYACLLGRLGYLAEASGYGRGACVVVDHCRAAALDAVDKGSHGAVVGVLKGERLVQLPPESFKYLRKVLCRFPWGSHAPGESAVEVHVGVDEARHDKSALGIDEFCLGISGSQFGCRSHHEYSRTPDCRAAIGNKRQIWIPCDKFSVSDEKHFFHSLTKRCGCFWCKKALPDTGEPDVSLSYFRRAMASISTSTSLGSLATSTHDLAGASFSKNLP